MKKRTSRNPILLLLAVISFVFISFATPINAEAAPAQTLDARNITLNSAQVWDTLSSTTYVYSDYLYLSTNYSDVANAKSSALAKSETSKLKAKYLYWTLNNLSPNTTYYYRFAYKTSSSSGYTYSGVASFKTSLPGIVGYSSWGANTITSSSVHIYANLPSTIKVNGCTGIVWEDTGTQCKQVYSKTDAAANAMYFWYDVTGLKPGTKYGWSITYTDQYGREVATSGTFTTLSDIPAPITFSTGGVNEITTVSAHIYGNLPTTVKISGCTGTVYEKISGKLIYSKTDAAANAMYFWYDVSGLEPNKEYKWDITYTDQYGRKISTGGTFKTLATTELSFIEQKLLEIQQIEGFRPHDKTMNEMNCKVFVNHVWSLIVPGVKVNPQVEIGGVTKGAYLSDSGDFRKIQDTMFMPTNSQVTELLKKLMPGDIIQYGSNNTGCHAVIVSSVSSDGITLYHSAHMDTPAYYTVSLTKVFFNNPQAFFGSFTTSKVDGLTAYRYNK